MKRTVSIAWAACVAVLVLLPAGAAGAAESGTVGIRPAAGGDWLRAALAPGETTVLDALVENKTARQVVVKVYAVDATITKQGGFALRGESEPRVGIGTWVDAGATSLALAPAGSVRVPVRLSVPKDADPGDYAGGVIVEQAARPGSASNVGSDVAVQFNVIERVGLRVYLTVKGAAVRRLQIGALERRAVGDDIEFRVSVRNTGTVRIAPAGTLSLSGFRVGARTLTLDGPDVLLPGTDATLTVLWKDPPAFARVAAQASVAGGPSPLTAATGLWLVPWRLFALLAALTLIVVFAVVRAARYLRRARRALAIVESAHTVPEEIPMASVDQTEDEPAGAWSADEPWETEQEWTQNQWAERQEPDLWAGAHDADDADDVVDPPGPFAEHETRAS